MALQTSGAISLNDIAGEFGGSTPHSLSEYYGAGGAPASGTISLLDFYGLSAGIDATPDFNDTWSRTEIFDSQVASHTAGSQFWGGMDAELSDDGMTLMAGSRNSSKNIEVWKYNTSTSSWALNVRFDANSEGAKTPNQGLAAMSKDGTTVAWMYDSFNIKVYRWNGTGTGILAWTEIADFSHTTSSSSTPRKIRISADGNTIALTNFYNPATVFVGTIWVWDYNGSAYTLRNGGPLEGASTSSRIFFDMFDLSADGNSVCYIIDQTSPTREHVLVKNTWNGSSWNVTNTLTDTTEQLLFPTGDNTLTRLCVGSANAHVVSIYETTGSTFSLVGTMPQSQVTSDGVAEWGEIARMSGDGNICAVATYQHDSQGFTDNGIIEVFRYNGSAWVSADSLDLLGPPDSSVQMGAIRNKIHISEKGGVIMCPTAGRDNASFADVCSVQVFTLA